MEKDIIKALYDTVESRRREPQEGSYTCYLFDQGIDKICKKVGEEAAETIIAAKNGSSEELTADMRSHISSHCADERGARSLRSGGGGAGKTVCEDRQPQKAQDRRQEHMNL